MLSNLGVYSNLVTNDKHLALLRIKLGHRLCHFEAKLLLELPDSSLLLAIPGPARLGVLVPFVEGGPNVLSHVADFLELQILAVLPEQVGIIEFVVAGFALRDTSLNLVACGSNREQEHDCEDVDDRVHDLLKPRVREEHVRILTERQQVLVNQTTSEYLHDLLQLAVVVPLSIHAHLLLFVLLRC